MGSYNRRTGKRPEKPDHPPRVEGPVCTPPTGKDDGRTVEPRPGELERLGLADENGEKDGESGEEPPESGKE
jgi:hypothetical protein